MENQFENINLENVKSTFQSNIIQMFAVTKFALPHLKRGASIINSTSITAYKGSPSLSACIYFYVGVLLLSAGMPCSRLLVHQRSDRHVHPIARAASRLKGYSCKRHRARHNHDRDPGGVAAR
jgi:NAD(P)-dependent dehydrogenase (short-subunit alcohol dehydrogenase family)